MHELGVVFHVIESVEKIAKANNVSRVSQVTLEIGEVSMIVKDQFIDCWNWAIKKSHVLSKCNLTILTVPAITYCEDCKQTYPTVQYGKICPHCKSNRTYLQQGNEIVIKEIGVLEDEQDDVEDRDPNDSGITDYNPLPANDEPPTESGEQNNSTDNN